MTNKIIEAARLAGIGVLDQKFGFVVYGDVTVKDLERFYAIARAEALEDAAKVAETQQDLAEQEKADKRFKAALKEGDERNAVDRGDHWMCVSTCNAVLRNAAKAIRAMKETP